MYGERSDTMALELEEEDIGVEFESVFVYIVVRISCVLAI